MFYLIFSCHFDIGQFQRNYLDLQIEPMCASVVAVYQGVKKIQMYVHQSL